jgi:hypothetical protein
MFRAIKCWFHQEDKEEKKEEKVVEEHKSLKSELAKYGMYSEVVKHNDEDEIMKWMTWDELARLHVGLVCELTELIEKQKEKKVE